MKKKNRINKQQLVIEFVSVVFAVILALVLNNWRESSALNANLNKVKESIIQEANRNDSLLQESHAYRASLLQDLYANKNLLLAAPVQDFSVDLNDNEALAQFFKTSLLFGQKNYYENVLIEQEGSERVLVLGNNVFDIVIESDSLKLFGVGNIQLKIPDVSNRSWQLAQATNTIVLMDVELVEQLSLVNTLIDTYIKAGDNALKMIYSDNQNGLIAVIEDLYTLESQIIKANTNLLRSLNQ
ncbi:MAG: hypothetical protein JJ895_10370 [Balneolaceae bacterium]|nr:hypothetical protein [Balneolaceae bacterium]